MADAVAQIRVGIGQSEYLSEDGGKTWSWGPRVPAGWHTPIVRGDVDIKRLPLETYKTFWDFVTLLPCGFGAAAFHQKIGSDKTLAGIFVTNDGGRHWSKARLPNLRPIAWPAENFQSLVLPRTGTIALGWDDPWLLDGAEAHVIYSENRGESWRYHCLGATNPYLALDRTGRLLAANDGYFMESCDGNMTWQERRFQIDWPEGYADNRVAMLRHEAFTTNSVGYALIVHWTSRLTRESPPAVGLLRSTDNGLRWKHLQVFEGPASQDINERHVLDLRVG